MMDHEDAEAEHAERERLNAMLEARRGAPDLTIGLHGPIEIQIDELRQLYIERDAAIDRQRAAEDKRDAAIRERDEAISVLSEVLVYEGEVDLHTLAKDAAHTIRGYREQFAQSHDRAPPVANAARITAEREELRKQLSEVWSMVTALRKEHQAELDAAIAAAKSQRWLSVYGPMVAAQLYSADPPSSMDSAVAYASKKADQAEDAWESQQRAGTAGAEV